MLRMTAALEVQLEDGLDIGCNSGEITDYLKRLTTNVTGLDFSAPLIELARARFPSHQFVVADALSLPFHDEAFDVFTAFHSLTAISQGQWRRALAEAFRVLKPGGFGIITVPRELSRLEGVVRSAYYLIRGMRGLRSTVRYFRSYAMRLPYSATYRDLPSACTVKTIQEELPNLAGAIETVIVPKNRFNLLRGECGIIVRKLSEQSPIAPPCTFHFPRL